MSKQFTSVLANDNISIKDNVVTGIKVSESTLVASYKEKETDTSIDDTVLIEVKEKLVVGEIVINPLINELKQGRSVDLTANLYKNGIKQSDKVSATLSGADYSDCYNWSELDGNRFRLENNYSSSTPLLITFKCGEFEKVIEVKLTDLF